jgi:flagellar hook assembly protein FlgD
MIFSFGGDRETFNFFDPFNYLNVDNDVWKFSYNQINNSNNLRINQEYPHRNKSTIINFQIPSKGNVLVEIYNLSGRLIKSFDLNDQEAGKHKLVWDGSDSKGRKLSRGIYISKLNFKGDSVSKNILISH